MLDYIDYLHNFHNEFSQSNKFTVIIKKYVLHVICHYDYIYTDDCRVIIWKRYTIMMSRGDGLSDGCSILGGRPDWKNLHSLSYKFLNWFPLSFNLYVNRVVNIDGI